MGTGTTGYDRWVAPLCWSAVALEGFDLVVLGVVLPSLLAEPSWGLTPSGASALTAVGLLGVMAGALAAGPLADRIGRRRAMVWTVVAFSVVTLLCAVATGPVVFGVLRFLAGLGLGGVLPVALAMVAESGRAGRTGSATTTLMTGYHAGAVLTALLGRLLIEDLGWRVMFVLGALPAVVLVPLLARRLPDLVPAAPEQDGSTTRNPIAQLVRGGFLRSSVAFWVTSFMGLLLVYGLNTWLPVIMLAAGYELNNALLQLLVLNVGAVLGLLVAGQVADRIGVRRAAVAWFAAAALFLALLSIRLPGATVYVGVLLAGVFVFSSQVLVYAYVSRHYPEHARASALGAASGVGRLGAISGPLVAGLLVGAGLAYPWGFYVFAVVALIGAVAIVGVRRHDAAARDAATAAG